jgi:pyruvate formate lyase activating enzyme
MHCAWCQNPESISPANQVWWSAYRCIDCAACLAVCPSGAISTTSGYSPNPTVCIGCGRCVDACPAKARENTRRDWSVDELLAEVCRDREFMVSGGVTVSGGEPLSQSEFVAAFLKQCREQGLHTALDTCGYASPAKLTTLLPHCDLVLYDLKLMDPDQHQKWTGVNNLLILENLKMLAAAFRKTGRPGIWIRTPLIPGATANETNIRAIGNWLREHLGAAIQRWELCAFNPLCVEKYQRLGKQWDLAGIPLLEFDTGRRLLEVARQATELDENRVILKGGMRTSDPQP